MENTLDLLVAYRLLNWLIALNWQAAHLWLRQPTANKVPLDRDKTRKREKNEAQLMSRWTTGTSPAPAKRRYKLAITTYGLRKKGKTPSFHLFSFFPSLPPSPSCHDTSNNNLLFFLEIKTGHIFLSEIFFQEREDRTFMLVSLHPFISPLVALIYFSVVFFCYLSAGI